MHVHQVLALRTLATSDFSDLGHDFLVLRVVRDWVSVFLDDSRPVVRQQAAITCCKLLVKEKTDLHDVKSMDVKPPSASNQLMKVMTTSDASAYDSVLAAEDTVNDILAMLLTVAISDSNQTIRRDTLRALDERYDPYLGQSENLRSLFIALHDESFEVQMASMTIISRLSEQYPSLIMPVLRQTLVQILTKMEYSEDSRGKEESGKLLGIHIYI
jgi:FKBP12-rapamycin complex-associated protein